MTKAYRDRETFVQSVIPNARQVVTTWLQGATPYASALGVIVPAVTDRIDAQMRQGADDLLTAGSTLLSGMDGSMSLILSKVYYEHSSAGGYTRQANETMGNARQGRWYYDHSS